MTRAVVLTAGRGSRLGLGLPKALVEFAGRRLVDWQLPVLRPRTSAVGLVTGFRADLFEGFPGVELFHNERHATTSMVASLFSAAEWLDGTEDLLVVYADVLFEPVAIEALTQQVNGDIGIVVNTKWHELWAARFADPLVDAESLRLDEEGAVVEIGRRPRCLADVQAQYMGLVRIAAPTHDLVLRYWGSDRERLSATSMTDFLQRLVDDGVRVRTDPVAGGWIEFDSETDLRLYRSLHEQGRLARFIDLSVIR
ncbi:CTP:phosphoglutamine cytidylyltransferase [Actinosynnema sp. ALI-1.44]